MLTAPYGSWPSPITARHLTASVVGLSRGTVDGDQLYWAESHADQGGRVGLWRQDPDGTRVELTPHANVRNAINEYGGGEWTVAGGIVVFSTYPGHDVYVIEGDRSVRLLVRGGVHRFGCLSVDQGRRLVLAVREDHEHSDRDCVNTIVALDLDAANPDGGRVLVEGADFYASPALSPDGQLAWVEWDHPNMPWDATSLMVAPLDRPHDRRRVAGGPEESAVHPTWADDGSLVMLSDTSGFWNFHRWDGRQTVALHDHPWDFCGPLWRLDPAPYTLIDAGRIGCSWLVDGIAHIGVLAFDTTEPTPAHLNPLLSDAVSASITGPGRQSLALLGFADRPGALHRIDWDSGTNHVVRPSSDSLIDSGFISRAVPRTWAGPDGDVHAWYYPPANPGVVAPSHEMPPAQVWSHGGPTGFAAPDFRLATQYWTSRGIGILDVNYSGSSGYGRAYRQRLAGNWGISDVRDCIDGALSLVADGLADPARLSIRGSSAGGYTTLRALTTSRVFSAGISLYGIGDLEALEADGHKFESHYTQNLVAPYPQGQAIYLERSPIHHLDALNCPMLIMQGMDDRVVPPSQAEAMAAAVRQKRLPLAVLSFDGEGHGFRRAETIIAATQACLSFLAQVYGFTPAGDIPVLTVENLPTRR